MVKINRWELDQLSESEYNDLITKANYDQEVNKHLDVPESKPKNHSDEEIIK